MALPGALAVAAAERLHARGLASDVIGCLAEWEDDVSTPEHRSVVIDDRVRYEAVCRSITF